MKWTPARLADIRSRFVSAMRHMSEEDVPLASVMWCLASMGALYLATTAWERALYRVGAAPLRPFFDVLSDIWSATNDPPLGVIDGGPEEAN
jgi:hypothetical protein